MKAANVPILTEVRPQINNIVFVSARRQSRQQIHLIKKKSKEILGIIEKIIVELKGAPSKTSGDQKWKEAQDNLKSKVPVIRINPVLINKYKKELFAIIGKENNIAKWLKLSVPTDPYKIEEPKRKNPEMKEPAIKYLIADSAEKIESRLKQAKI